MAFLHMPKCAGSSVRLALESAVPAGEVAPLSIGAMVFCGGFDRFDQLSPQVRARVVVDHRDIERVGAFRYLLGHFSFPGLRRISQDRHIATVVREPRARLLSLYEYWRTADFSALAPYEGQRYAQGSFFDFLSEPEAAPAVDNQYARLLLRSDPLIPTSGFIEDDAIEPLCRRAVEAIERLGWVGLQEKPDELWSGLSDFFGVPLAPTKINVTATFETEGIEDVPPRVETIDRAAIAALERRTAVDAAVYRAVLERKLPDSDPKAFADREFTRRLQRA
jgi:hypothetical protein